MSAFTSTRRAGLAATIFSLSFAVALAEPAVARHYSAGGVSVDVSPLLANSGEPTAGWVANELPRALASALASSGRAGTPTSVRIDYVLLGGTDPNRPIVSAPDQIVGEVTMEGVTRPLRATTSYYPAAPDTPNFEASNHARVSRLVDALAGWIARGY